MIYTIEGGSRVWRALFSLISLSVISLNFLIVLRLFSFGLRDILLLKRLTSPLVKTTTDAFYISFDWLVEILVAYRL